jgi:hypothetical protein
MKRASRIATFSNRCPSVFENFADLDVARQPGLIKKHAEDRQDRQQDHNQQAAAQLT